MHVQVYIIVVPWVSRVYGICTLSVVICIPEGETRGNITTGRVQLFLVTHASHTLS